MPGVPPELSEHELHLDPQAKLLKQRLHHFTQVKKDVIKKEIARLLDPGFMKEVYHPDWIANPILLPKKNKDWRMCVDYTDRNKACKIDPFGLPQINQVVDSAAGCSLLSFSTATQGIIKSNSRWMTRSRHLSSLHSVHFVTQLCPSDSKAWVQLISGVYNGVCTHSLGATQKRKLTTWL
jgi:hypothetical protein